MNNPTHELTKEELMAYLDGELAPDRAASASAHLESCQGCRKAANQFRELSQGLSVWQVERYAEEDFPTRLAQALGEAKEPKKGAGRRQLWARWSAAALAAAAVCAVMVMAVLVQRSGLPDQAEIYQPNRSMLTARERTSRSEPQTTGSDLTVPNRASGGVLSVASDVGNALAEAPGRQESVTPGPLLVRSAELTLRVKSVGAARVRMEADVGKRQGYMSTLNQSSASQSTPDLRATVRVPAQWLESTLADLRGLGHVEQENQVAEDVTRQSADLDVRLANAHVTEERLVNLLRLQTGRLSDILQVEEQITRVRGEIEQMESERRDLSHRVAYATVSVALHEDVRVTHSGSSTGEQLWHAAETGWNALLEGMLSTATFLLGVGPELLFWGGLAVLAGWLVWRRVHRTR